MYTLPMALTEPLAELRAKRDAIERTILSLERLAEGRRRRRPTQPAPDLTKVFAELRAERDQMEEAILYLERRWRGPPTHPPAPPAPPNPACAAGLPRTRRTRLWCVAGQKLRQLA